jgi:hypothetical protein
MKRCASCSRWFVEASMSKRLHFRNLWTRSWSGEWFLIDHAFGTFDANGDFIVDGPGGWICRKADNVGHLAFA